MSSKLDTRFSVYEENLNLTRNPELPKLIQELGLKNSDCEHHLGLTIKGKFKNQYIKSRIQQTSQFFNVEVSSFLTLCCFYLRTSTGEYQLTLRKFKQMYDFWCEIFKDIFMELYGEILPPRILLAELTSLNNKLIKGEEENTKRHLERSGKADIYIYVKSKYNQSYDPFKTLLSGK